VVVVALVRRNKHICPFSSSYLLSYALLAAQQSWLTYQYLEEREPGEDLVVYQTHSWSILFSRFVHYS
jgi:hypothetical protein